MLVFNVSSGSMKIEMIWSDITFLSNEKDFFSEHKSFKNI